MGADTSADTQDPEKERQRMQFWIVVEVGLSCRVSSYLKNLLKFAGFDNHVVMKMYDKKDSYDKLVKTGRSAPYKAMADKSDCDKEQFFSPVYADSPQEFDIVDGDQLLLIAIKDYCADEKNLDKFIVKPKTSKKGTGKDGIPAQKKILIPAVPPTQKKTNFTFDKEKEITKLKNLLISTNAESSKSPKNVEAKEFLKKNENLLNIEILFDEKAKKITAEIPCVVEGCNHCPKYTRNNTQNWSISNMHRHVISKHVGEKSKRKQPANDGTSKKRKLGEHPGNGKDAEVEADVDLTNDKEDFSEDSESLETLERMEEEVPTVTQGLAKSGPDGEQNAMKIPDVNPDETAQIDPLGLGGAVVRFVLETNSNQDGCQQGD